MYQALSVAPLAPADASGTPSATTCFVGEPSSMCCFTVAPFACTLCIYKQHQTSARLEP